MADLARYISTRKNTLKHPGGGTITSTLMVIAQPDHHLGWRRRLAIGLAAQYGCRVVIVGDCFAVGVVGYEANVNAVTYDYSFVAASLKEKAWRSWRNHQMRVFRERKRRVRHRLPQDPRNRVADRAPWMDAYIDGALDALLEAEPLEAVAAEAVTAFYPNVRRISHGTLSNGRARQDRGDRGA